VAARAYVLVQGRPQHHGRAADLAEDPIVRDLFSAAEVAPMLKASHKEWGNFT